MMEVFQRGRLASGIVTVIYQALHIGTARQESESWRRSHDFIAELAGVNHRNGRPHFVES